MKTIKELLYIFNKKQKLQLVVLGIMIVIGALFELLGITSILPFVSIAINPTQVFENKKLFFLYSYLGMTSTNLFLALLAVALIIVYIIKNIYLVYMNNKIFEFSYDNQRKLTNRMLRCYLREPYTFFLENNSADLLRNVKDDTSLMFETVLATMNLCVECLVSLVLLVFLMLTDKSITLVVGFVLVGFLFFIMKVIKNKIKEYGTNTREARGDVIRWLMQTFGGVKEIKIKGSEEYFENQVDAENEIWVENQKKYMIMSYLPKPAMETVCIGSVLSVVAVKLLMGVSSEYFITTVSVFAVAAFRLLPAFNRITGHISKIMFNRASVDAVYSDLLEIEHYSKDTYIKEDDNGKNLSFNDSIYISELSFSYPNSDSMVLDSISFKIEKNTSIALVGASGAGKTTLADIILGLLPPNSGDILVDGVSIYDNIKGWQRNLGYIPQAIYLLDDTIERNIAFAEPNDVIDKKRLMEVIEEAQLTDFINELNEGVNTVIGEGGIRLSGGQRQRIGIARALYSNPDVLILDEATSALDNDTEKAVMDAIDKLGGKKTLIIIAHRLSTIKNCDYVYEVGNKKVVRNR